MTSPFTVLGRPESSFVHAQQQVSIPFPSIFHTQRLASSLPQSDVILASTLTWHMDVRVQILIWFQTFLLFKKPNFQTFIALKITSLQAFQIISDFLFSKGTRHWVKNVGFDVQVSFYHWFVWHIPTRTRLRCYKVWTGCRGFGLTSEWRYDYDGECSFCRWQYRPVVTWPGIELKHSWPSTTEA